MIALLNLGCASRAAFRRGEEAFQKNEMDQAVQYYMRALQSDPENVRYRFSLGRSLISASNYHLHRGEEMLQAGDARVALFEFEKALEFNPDNNEARRQKATLLRRLAEEKKRIGEESELEKLKEKVAQSESARAPQLHPDKNLFKLKLGETDLTTILRALQSLSGVRILFDKNFQSQKLAVDLELVSFKEALDKILIQTKNFYKVIDDRTIIVIPDDPRKRVEYNELVMRTFFLSNADPKLVEKEVKDIAGIKVSGISEPLNAITLRDTPNRIAVAEKLIRTLDKPRAELLVDVEILEVNRRRMKRYGIELSQYYVGEFLNTWPVTDFSKVGPGAPVRGNVLKHLNLSDFFFSLPSVAYKLMQEDTMTKVKAKPQLRVVDQQQIVVHLGDRAPILQTSFVPNYGTSATDPLRQNPINTYTWEDLGIKITMTPRVHHDGWVTLTLDFMLNFITDPGSDIRPPTIGTRNVKSVIRLQDNETGILAGLLRDNERSSARGLPGLTNLPILKEIFASNDKEISQTDVILTITPRIIKFPDIDEEDLRSYLIGTEENIGLKERLPDSPFDKLKEQQPVEVVVPPPPAAAAAAAAAAGAAAAQTQPAPGATQTAPAEPPPTPEYRPQDVEVPSYVPAPSAPSEPQLPSEDQQQSARLSLVVASPTVAVGQTGDVELVLENVKELQMVEGDLRFPPDKLQAQQVEMSDFVRARGGDIKATIDNTTGKVSISVVLGGMASDLRRESLAIVHFKAVSPGEARIDSPEMHVFDPRLNEPPATFTGTVLTVTTGDERER